MSSLMNKVKEALHSDKDKNKSSRTEGSHDSRGQSESRTSNTGDSRVESDRGYRESYGNDQNEPYASGDNYAYGGADQGQTGSRGTGDYGRNPRGTGTGTGYQTSEYPEGAYGQHGTRTSQSDPRYDPAYDSSRRQPGDTGAYGTGRQGTGAYGTESGAYGTQGTGTGTYGHSEGHESHGALGDEGRHAGRHSDSTGAGGTGGSHPYASTGPAPNTAGPHKSDMMNKLDPRVDSDLDGSKTYGGNKTFPHQS